MRCLHLIPRKDNIKAIEFKKIKPYEDEVLFYQALSRLPHLVELSIPVVCSD